MQFLKTLQYEVLSIVSSLIMYDNADVTKACLQFLYSAMCVITPSSSMFNNLINYLMSLYGAWGVGVASVGVGGGVVVVVVVVVQAWGVGGGGVVVVVVVVQVSIRCVSVPDVCGVSVVVVVVQSQVFVLGQVLVQLQQ